MFKDYYEILEIDPEASKAEIKRRYLKLARKYHPDVNPSEPSSGEKFKEINKAYAVLFDEKRRKSYDAIRDIEKNHEKYQNQASIPGSKRTWTYKTHSESSKEPMDSNFAKFRKSQADKRNNSEVKDPFVNLKRVYDVSGRNRSYKESRPFQDGEDLVYDLKINFMEAFYGGEKAIKYLDPVTKKPKTLIVKYSKGVRDNHKLRLQGKGIPGSKGGEDGDLYVILHVEEHPRFERRGNDILLKKTINYTTAILGGTFKVGGVKEKLTIKVPPKTKDLSLLRVKNKGFTIPKSNRRGDLLIEVNIRIPDRINKFQKKHLLKLRDLGL